MSGAARHPVVPGTNGVRKVRFADPGDHRGKSGSYRACYAYFSERGIVFLITLLAKNQQADIPEPEKKQIAQFIREVESELGESS